MIKRTYASEIRSHAKRKTIWIKERDKKTNLLKLRNILGRSEEFIANITPAILDLQKDKLRVRRLRKKLKDS